MFNFSDFMGLNRSSNEKKMSDAIWNKLTFEEIRQILESSTIEEIRGWRSNYHPLLHEAAEQSLQDGAQNILKICWENENLRSLFTDATYLDKYGYTPLQRLEKVAATFKDINRVEPEIVTHILKVTANCQT